MENLGETIRELRIERGLTQPELAKLVGVSKGMISIWENNVNEPKASFVKRLALVLEVSSDYLLNIEK